MPSQQHEQWKQDRFDHMDRKLSGCVSCEFGQSRGSHVPKHRGRHREPSQQVLWTCERMHPHSYDLLRGAGYMMMEQQQSAPSGGEAGHPAVDPGVGDFVRYMAEVHHLPLYLTPSPCDLQEGIPVDGLSKTARDTLDTISMLGGQVTASMLVAKEGIRPSAAANRLANLDREGYLVRQSRGRREGDMYIEPRSAESIPIVDEDEITIETVNRPSLSAQ